MESIIVNDEEVVYTKDGSKYTLETAVRYGIYEVVSIMNIPQNRKVTDHILFLAINTNRGYIVKLLLEKKLKPTLKHLDHIIDTFYKKAHDKLQYELTYKCAKLCFENSPELIKELQINNTNAYNFGSYPLDVIECAFKKGADPNNIKTIVSAIGNNVNVFFNRETCIESTSYKDSIDFFRKYGTNESILSKVSLYFCDNAKQLETVLCNNIEYIKDISLNDLLIFFITKNVKPNLIEYLLLQGANPNTYYDKYYNKVIYGYNNMSGYVIQLARNNKKFVKILEDAGGNKYISNDPRIARNMKIQDSKNAYGAYIALPYLIDLFPKEIVLIILSHILITPRSIIHFKKHNLKNKN
jgi:hypothetical protein